MSQLSFSECLDAGLSLLEEDRIADERRALYRVEAEQQREARFRTAFRAAFADRVPDVILGEGIGSIQWDHDYFPVWRCEGYAPIGLLAECSESDGAFVVVPHLEPFLVFGFYGNAFSFDRTMSRRFDDFSRALAFSQTSGAEAMVQLERDRAAAPPVPEEVAVHPLRLEDMPNLASKHLRRAIELDDRTEALIAIAASLLHLATKGDE